MNIRARTIIGLVAALALAGGANAGAATAPVRGQVSLWLPYWDMPAAYESAAGNAAVVGTANPFWYEISGDARIVDHPGAGDAEIVDGLRARGIDVVPTVTESEDMSAFDRLLTSAPRRAAMVHALLAIARSRAYGGLDLDFEDFAVDSRDRTSLADRAASAYPALVGEICAALHALEKTCTVTIMARTTSTRQWQRHLANWVYDYGALAAVADRVRVMAYDDHFPAGPPGPIAPYPWVEQVVGYIRATMPVAKAELGMPAYGYDWSGGGAVSMTSQVAPQIAAEHHVKPTWDATQAESTFRYREAGHQHIVWYEGATAEYDRARLALTAGLAGVDLWAAGGEQPALWPLLRTLYARSALSE